MTTLTPRYEGLTGASLSGTSGTANRTYTLSYSTYYSIIEILVQGSPQHENTDFTVSSTGVITFLNVIFDDMVISLRYFTGDTSTIISTGMGYVTTSDVLRTAGITSTEVSTTDVANHILDAETYICRYTKNIYYKTNLNNQVVSSATDTTITKNSAGWTSDAYIDQYVYIISGTGIGQYRKITSNTTDTITVDRSWSINPDNTSTFKVFYVPSTFNPFQDKTGDDALDGNGATYYFLPYYPVRALETLNTSATTVTISNVYLWKETGKMQLKSGAEASRFSNAYPQYLQVKYWYGVDHLPQDVAHAVTLHAAIETLVQQMGGTFDDPSSVNLPDLSVTIGQAYINIEGTVRRLQEELKDVLKNLKIYPQFAY